MGGLTKCRGVSKRTQYKHKKITRNSKGVFTSWESSPCTRAPTLDSAATLSENLNHPLLQPDAYQSKPLEEMCDGKTVENSRKSHDQVFPMPRRQTDNSANDTFGTYLSYS